MADKRPVWDAEANDAHIAKRAAEIREHSAESVPPRYEWVADALAEALDLVEEYAQYVSPFLLEKWGHAGDLARLQAVLADARTDGEADG